MPEFVIVARAASALYFTPDGHFRVRSFPSPLGPLDVLFRTRRVMVDGITEPVPKGLWVEIRGQAPGLREALDVFPQIAQLLVPVLSLVANAPTEDLVPELAFDCSPGDIERDFFQQFVFDERFLTFARPKFPGRLAYRVVELFGRHVEQDRLHRATTHYHVALQHWAPGAEITALGHLWMGMEAMTPVALRKHLADENITRDNLAGLWAIGVKDIDSEVRRRLLFRGDDATYARAREASDGFEHGYLPFQTIREHAKATKVATARLLRAAILSHLGLDGAEQVQLSEPPYDTPPLLRIDKYMFGKLKGPAENLAAADQVYPILQWSSKPSELVTLPDGTVRLGFTEKMAPRLGPGVTFQPRALEVWGGPGVKPTGPAPKQGT